MELVHKVPVTWTHDKIVSCDGGGGPAGHPRIFINTDKPEIASCNYCGTPFVRLTAQYKSMGHWGKANNQIGQRAPPKTPRIPTRDFLPPKIDFFSKAGIWVIELLGIDRPWVGSQVILY